MGTRDLVKFRIIEDFREGKVSRREAATILGISEKTVTRLAKKLRERGADGLRHGNKGRSPHNKLAEELRQAALEKATRIYPDFNMVHCLEMLTKDHGVQASYSTFRSWCRRAGIGKHRKRRTSKQRVYRERMANEGLMLQMDGSRHLWNGKDEWCLIALIDDATSDIPAAAFHEGETTLACMKTLRVVIETRGIPEVIYTDEAGWAGGSSKRNNFAQFVRACEELGTRVIRTSSAEAKGRIERTWRTMQDRLVPELRLFGITGMLDANRYLQQTFLPEYWRKRNTVVATSPLSRYKPVPAGLDLDEVFCLKYLRTVRSNHTVDYDNQTLKITTKELGSLKGKQVAIHVKETGSLALFYGSKQLSWEPVVRPVRQWLPRLA